MRTFKSLTVKGLPLFQEQTFALDHKGLTVISGLNLNGVRKASASRNTNAVGKSMFFSRLKDLAYKEGATGVAKDRIKQGEDTVELQVGERNYELSRYVKGKTERYRIIKDGKEETASDIKDQRERIQQKYGIDEDTFNLIVYLDSDNPIRKGDTAFRRSFFTRFFDLTSADYHKKLIENEKDRLSKVAVALKEVQEQIDELRASIADVSYDQLKASLEEAQTGLSQATEAYERMKRARRYHNFVQNHARTLELCRDEEGRPTDPAKLIDGLQSELSQLRRMLGASRKHTQYREDLQNHQRARQARDAYIDQHSLDPEKAEAQRTKLERFDTSIEEEREKINAARAKIASAEALADVNDASCKAAKKRLRELTSTEDAVCPTCGNKLTSAHREKEIDSLTKAIKEFVALRADFETRLEVLREKEKIAVQSYQIMKENRAKIVARVGLYENIPHVPRKPEPPELKVEIPESWDEAAAARQASKIEEQLESLRDLEPYMGDDAGGSTKALLTDWISGKRDTFNDDKFDDLLRRVTELQAEVSGFEAQMAAREKAGEILRNLRQKRTAMQEELKDVEVVEILSNAYNSNKGVKQLQINALCRELEAKVNKYAQYLFIEPYTFEFDLGTQFQIIVTRKLGNETMSSDVRTLSGSEAPMFDLTLALALISFLPPSRRCNLMILDELDAKFGPDATQTFLRFLPILNKAIPHVIVITPKTDTNYGDTARYFTVVKKGSVSRIIEGRHTSSDTLPKPRTKEKA